MKITLQLTIFFLFAAIGSVLGQTDFRDGFIITLENDTVRGKIAYRSNSKNYQSCIFQLNKKKTTYLPSQIIGFGYEHGKYFSTQIEEGTFVEVLVIGKLSLFKADSKYFLKKANVLTELVSNRKIVEENGQYGYRGGKLWKRLVYSQIDDCKEVDYDLIDNLKFDEKRLTKLVVNYNECTTAEFLEIKGDQPWTKIRVGIMAGVNRSTVNTVRKQFDFFPYLADSYTSTDPSIGLMMEFIAPRISDKVALQVETHFIKTTFISFLELDRGGTEYYDTYFDMSALSVPVSLKYFLLKNKTSFYVQAGVGIEQNLHTDSRLLAETVVGNVVSTAPITTLFEFSNTRFTYFGGVGINRVFQNFGVDLSARYTQLSAPSKSDSFTLRQNRMSLNLLLFKK